MSAFETSMAATHKHHESAFGQTVTVTHADQSTESVTAIIVEDVGATDPYIERTFLIAESEFSTTLQNGEQLGPVNGSTWVVIKIRNGEDGVLEVRTRAPEEIV